MANKKNKLKNCENGILYGRECDDTRYRICNFRKELLPLYEKTLELFRRENPDDASLLKFDSIAYYRPYKGNGRDANVTINLPNHYALWAKYPYGAECNVINMSRFWRIMFQLKELINEGVVVLEPYTGIISDRTFIHRSN